jgi:hypothetical protein
VLATGVLATGTPIEAGAPATTATYNISGTNSKVTNNCFNIAVSLTGDDCSYAKTRSPPSTTWRGPINSGSFYAKGSVGDNLDYIPSVGDGKINVPMTGSLTIDDAGTPLDGSDDLISGEFNFGPAAYNISTGNNDRALERWDGWNHVMAPTQVSAGVAEVGGGFAYRIGSRGTPTPNPLFARLDPSDTWPSENVASGTGAPCDPNDPATKPCFWDPTRAFTNPASGRVGIERSRGFGGFGGGQPLTPNVGATTVGTMVNWECIDVVGDTDCTISASVIGIPVNGAPHDDNEPLSPGFNNVILLVTTDGAGNVTGQAYWTREYIIESGPAIGDDPAGTFVSNNSWAGGLFTISGALPADDPIAVDDVATTIQGVATGISVVANDTQGDGVNVVSIETDPAHGIAVASGLSVTYTPDATYDGPDSFDYRLTDETGGFATATVDVTVTDKQPTAGSFNANSSKSNPNPVIAVLNAPSVLGTGTAGDHTVTILSSTNGSCSAAGGNVTFTPVANGAASCDYEIEDFDGDTDTATITVSVSGVASGGGGGVAGPQLPSGGSSLGLLSLAALLAGVPLVARRRRSAG